LQKNIAATRQVFDIRGNIIAVDLFPFFQNAQKWKQFGNIFYTSFARRVVHGRCSGWGQNSKKVSCPGKGLQQNSKQWTK